VSTTQSEDDLINSSEHTHDYRTAYERDEHRNADDDLGYYIQRFERESQITRRARAEDVGGVILYRGLKTSRLLAFYDYENLCGTVF